MTAYTRKGLYNVAGEIWNLFYFVDDMFLAMGMRIFLEIFMIEDKQSQVSDVKDKPGR